jgi:hypothetical protein
MGTRSLTLVYDEARQPIINMYAQWDGYPSGHGLELAEFLNSIEAVTNGILVGEKRKTANGMGCLAAQMVAHFKTDVGSFYLYPVTAKDCGQEYEYHIYHDRVTIRFGNGEQFFTGPWSEFLNFCKNPVVTEE